MKGMGMGCVRLTSRTVTLGPTSSRPSIASYSIITVITDEDLDWSSLSLA